MEDRGVDGRKILRWIFRKWDVVEWTGLAQDRDRWRELLNAEMNLRFHKMGVIPLLAENRLASEGLRSME